MNSGSASGTRKAAIYYEGSARIARSWRTHVDNNGVRGKAAGGRTFQCIPSVVAESRPQNVWVGLLARRCRACSAAASPSPADGRVVERSSALTHSGGTAPDSHRTSVMPVLGTQTRTALYDDRVDAANLWTHWMRSSRCIASVRPVNGRR